MTDATTTRKFTQGDRVRTTAQNTYTKYGTIAAGSEGTVTHVFDGSDRSFPYKVQYDALPQFELWTGEDEIEAA